MLQIRSQSSQDMHHDAQSKMPPVNVKNSTTRFKVLLSKNDQPDLPLTTRSRQSLKEAPQKIQAVKARGVPKPFPLIDPSKTTKLSILTSSTEQP